MYPGLWDDLGCVLTYSFFPSNKDLTRITADGV